MINKKINRFGLITLVAMLTILALTCPATATAMWFTYVHEHVPVEENELTNPCTGGSIVLSGESNLILNVFIDNTGKWHGSFLGNTHLEGTDSSGVKYVYNNQWNENGYDASLPLVKTENVMLISQGSADNFLIKIILQVSPNGKYNIDFEDISCQGPGI